MNPRIARIAAWMIALALVATPIVAALNGWMADDRWPIRRLVVQGRFAQVSEAEVRAVVAPRVRTGFFAVELSELQAAVEALPWVERAEVRKHWPDRIDVHIEERVPIAFWGDERLLSSRGDLFAAETATVDPELPRLSGPDVRAADVWRQYEEARRRMATIGLTLVATRIDARGAWTVTASDGAEFLLGRERTLPRLDRFIAAVSRLPDSDRNRIERADLRFANGFAVVWRTPAAPPASVPAMPAQDTGSGSIHEPQV